MTISLRKSIVSLIMLKYFKALNTTNIVLVNNKAITSKKWEPSSKNIKNNQYFFKGDIFISNLYKKLLGKYLKYKGDFQIIHKNKLTNFI